MIFKKFYLLALIFSFLFFMPAFAKNNNFLLEINPLLLINQGIGISFEKKVATLPFSYGFDAEFYRQNPFAKEEITATKTAFSVAAKTRVFFFPDGFWGPFAGVRLTVKHTEAQISGAGIVVRQSKTFFAPAVQAGYRFVFATGITVSGYLGGAFFVPPPGFPKEALSSAGKAEDVRWEDARTALNANDSTFSLEYGVTFGYVF